MEDKKNRPDNSQFRQQRLPAWQPVMSPPHVTACLVFLAIIFIPIGIAIILANNKIFELEVRYDQVQKCTSSNNGGIQTYNLGGAWGTAKQGCRTFMNFTIDADVSGPVYLYYKLTNFYQNHRRFAKSRDTQQLAGNDVTPSTDCSPILVPGAFWGNTSVKAQVGDGTSATYQNPTYNDFYYSPCGLVAWSMFNDTYILHEIDAAGNWVGNALCDTSSFSSQTNLPLTNQSCSKKGVTWSSDYDKFKTPHMNSRTWTGDRMSYGQAAAFNSTDPFLKNGFYAFEAGHKVPITLDEDFMVWMRTASLPTFRKLYRIFDSGIKKGSYSMEILEFFDSQQYDGTKSFVLSTVSWVGAKNAFLGYAYIVVGAVCVVCALVFFIVHKATGNRTQEAIQVLAELR